MSRMIFSPSDPNLSKEIIKSGSRRSRSSNQTISTTLNEPFKLFHYSISTVLSHYLTIPLFYYPIILLPVSYYLIILLSHYRVFCYSTVLKKII
jgi:hypothetical protein